MTDHTIRLFADDAAIRAAGQGCLDHSLPATEWTHEAQLATCAWLQIERPDIDPSRDLLFSIPARRGWVEPDLAPLSLQA